MSRTAVAENVAAHFESRFLRHYVRSKIASDPLYEAVERELRGHDLPLLDIGCGVGLMAFYLRESGFTAPIAGVDHDASKTDAANRIASQYRDLRFDAADARSSMAAGSSVLILDLLHYLDDAEQARMLDSIAAAIPRGGVVIIRDAVRDGTLRYRLTYAAEVFARIVGWLKAQRLNFPPRDAIVKPFASRGFSVDVRPLWGRTPFNNYLFVFRREAEGITKV